MCVPHGGFGIPGAENHCVKGPVYAFEGETCNGFDEMTGNPFPKCAEGFMCLPRHGVSIPGAERHCVDI